MGYGERAREQGFMLLGLIVAIFLILLVLGVAAPRVARELRREREVETVRRGNQYVRAIQLYYRKFGHYPGSMEQLEKTNNIRFLRQQYVDPLTGKADWRIIKVGEAKTTVKGFFGKPLTGLTPGLGSAAGMASSGGIGAGAAGVSSPGATSPGSTSPGSALGGSSSIGSPLGGSSAGGLGSPLGGTSAPGSTAIAGGSSDTGFGAGSGMGSQSASSITGASGPFVGVGLVKDGDSIITLNEQTSYPTWEFIYDPRIEQLKAKNSLLGGAASSTDASGFGSGSGSGFGTSPSSGFGTSPTSPSPTSPTAPPAGGSTGTTTPQ
jgi:type II secretory pathway pseudopilin PulG